MQHFGGDASEIILYSCSPENFLQTVKTLIFVQNVLFLAQKSKLNKLKKGGKSRLLGGSSFHWLLIDECENSDLHWNLDKISVKIGRKNNPGLSISLWVFLAWRQGAVSRHCFDASPPSRVIKKSADAEVKIRAVPSPL